MSLTKVSLLIIDPGETVRTIRVATLDWQMIPQNWTSIRYGILFDMGFPT